MTKRVFSIVLAGILFLNTLLTGVQAAERSNTKECSHHLTHTVDCGYVEEVPGTPCTHEHNEDCYKMMIQCIHEHTQECCGDTEESTMEGDAAHGQSEPGACTHECSMESGCIMEVLDCTHEHDSECGYTEEVTGQPCGFVCPVCDPASEGMAAGDSEGTGAKNDRAAVSLSDIETELHVENRAELPAENETGGVQADVSSGNASVAQAPYYLFVIHSLDLDGEKYGGTDLIELTKDDFSDGTYDFSRNVMQKEGMKPLKASYLDNETYDLVEGWTVSLEDFAEGGDPKDGSNYYAVQVLIEYGAETGYRAVVSENPEPADDPYGIMPLANFTGANIDSVTFEAAYIVNVTVNYMYSPTGGLSGTPAADSERHQVLLTANEAASDEWSIPYYYKKDGTAFYQNLEGFRIVLDSQPLNAFLMDPDLADRMSANPDPETVKSAIENDLFTVNMNNPEMPVYYYVDGKQETNPTYRNEYSDLYNQAWNNARTITDTAGYYTASARTSTASAGGATPLVEPRLTVTIPDKMKQEIIGKLDAVRKIEDPEERVRQQKALDEELENALTVTVYYRRNVGFYTVEHWVPNLSSEEQGKYSEADGTKKEVDGITYYKVLAESKQGRIGAMTNAISGMDLMERTEDWNGFDFTPYVTEGFAQKIVEPDNGTTIEIYYDSASEYRIIFDTDDTYIPRVSAEMNDILVFKTEDGIGKLTVNDVVNNDYKNPERVGYTFAGWRYEVANQNATGAELVDGRYYVRITDTGFTINSVLLEDAKIVLANDDNSTVKAIHLYPIWEPAAASVRVVFWTEDLAGGVNDIAVEVVNPAGSYESRVSAYRNGNPNVVKENASFSNLGSFTFTATAEKVLNLSIANNSLATTTEGNFTAEDTSASGTLEKLINAVFEAKMPKVEASNGLVDTYLFYHPYKVERQDNHTYTVAADGSTVINVYYARNVYSVDFTYYGTVENRLSVATNTNGYSKGDNPKDYNFQYTGESDGSGSSVTNSWSSVSANQEWSVPEKITITAKYGADLRDVWPQSNYETINITGNSNRNYATFVSWGTTAGEYNAKFKADRANKNAGEATLMGIFSAMGADIIAQPEDPSTVHHMYAYWSDHNESYYRFNHCYEVPDLTWDVLDSDDTVVTYDITERIYGNSSPGTAMTGVSDAEKARRDTMYLVPVSGSLSDYFTDYSNVLMKVDAQGNEAADGKYYAVRHYSYTDSDNNNVDRLYALARQVSAVSTNSIDSQNPSARLNMTRANVIADHDTRVKDEDGIYTGNRVGSPTEPYDLYFYYDRDRFNITYMVPARSSASGEYTLGTREAVFGSSLSRYKVELDGNDKALYSNNVKFNNYWTAVNNEVSSNEAINENGYVRIVPNSAVNGTGSWTFSGWALDRAASQMVGEDDWTNDTISGHLRLFAIWKAPEYQVTFEMDGGVLPNGSGEDVKVPVLANQGYTSSGGTIPRPIKNGYTLSGWDWYTVDSTGQAKDLISDFTFETPITQDMIARAKWITFVPEYYSYKVWYLTNDDSAVRKTGDGWLSEAESGAFAANQDTNSPAGIAVADYDNILGCKFFANEPYPKGTNLLLGAESFAGYIPVNGNATIALDETNTGATAQDTKYVAYFYYNKAETRQYRIQFQPWDKDVVLDITQEGETDQAYFAPNDETFRALRTAGYQLVAMDENGDVITDPETGKPQTVTDVAGLSKFINAVNAEFKNGAGTVIKEVDGVSVVTFKVMPIDYTIVYDVGTVMLGNTEVENDSEYAELVEKMKEVLDSLKNTNAGGTVLPDTAIQNPTSYNVSIFADNFSFTLKTPTYVQNPAAGKETEWWKFTGWSLGTDTSENAVTRAVTGTLYPTIEVEHSVGDLTFLANWERVEAGLTVTNMVEANAAGLNVPAGDSFEYVITLPDGYVTSLFAYDKSTGAQVTIPADGTFWLQNGQTICFDNFEGQYTVNQTNQTRSEIAGETAATFDDTEKNYYSFSRATVDDVQSAGADRTVSSTLGTANTQDDVVFTNVYTATVDLDIDNNPANGNQGFPVTKYLRENGQRRNFFGGNDYIFSIRAGAQSAVDTPVPNVPVNEPDEERGFVTLTSRSDTQSISDSFGSVRFTKPGTYTYVIREERPEGEGVPGVSYDTKRYRITVDVTVDAAGTSLDAVVSRVQERITEDTSAGTDDGWVTIDNGANNLAGTIVFENTFNPSQVNRTFEPIKRLVGREKPLAAGEFTFTLTPAGSLVMDSAGATEYHDVATDNAAKLAFLKSLDTSGKFTDDPAQPMPSNVSADNKVTNGESGAILISSITYTDAHMGGNDYGKVYKYTLNEDVPADAVDGKYEGIVYDTETRTLYVYVHLHRTDGALAQLGEADTYVYADVLGDRNATFTNTYQPASIEVDLGEDEGGDTTGGGIISLEKQITGRNFRSGDSFTFTLTAAPGAPMPTDKDGNDVSTVVITPTEGSSGKIRFGTLAFTEAGSYTYRLREQKPVDADSRMIYDTEVKVITVTVTDDGEGNLTAVSEPALVLWKNRYTYDPVDVDLGGDGDEDGDGEADNAAVGLIKQIEGREFKAGDSFSFTLTAVTNGAPMPKAEDGSEIGQVTIHPESGTSAKIIFGKLTIDEVGDFEYTLREEAGTAGGMKYDTAARKLIVHVTDDGDGKLTATTEVLDESNHVIAEPVTWKNSYTTEPVNIDLGSDEGDSDGDSLVLALVKNITGRDFRIGDSFTFSLEADDSASPMPTDANGTVCDKVTITPVEGSSARMDFGRLTFDKAGVYGYTLKEQAGSIEDMTYDTEAKHIVITVADDGEGRLVAGCNVASVVWTNRYATRTVNVDLGSDGQDGSAGITLVKQLNGRDFRAGDSFTFTLAAESVGAPVPVGVDGTERSQVTIAPVAGNTAEIPFGRLTFTEAGEYVYTLKEQAGNANGMTYDTAEKRITIKVTEDGEGNLSAEIVNAITALTWVNAYAAVPVDVDLGGDEGRDDDGDGDTGSTVVGLVKQLNGRDFRAGDSFTFTISAAEGTPMPKNAAGEDITAITITPAEGNRAVVNFGKITFTSAGVYTYTLKEETGTAAGMFYDTAPKTLTITVTDNEGVLTAVADGVTWINTYDGAATDPGSDPDSNPGDGSGQNPGSNPDSGNGNGSGNGKLPQTGLLWWPAWLMAALGIAMIGGGIVRNKVSRRGKNER